MFQRFFTDSCISRYIKALLYSTPLPLYRTVDDGDYLIESCYYVYKQNIIKCDQSGYLRVMDVHYYFTCNESNVWSLKINDGAQSSLTTSDLTSFGITADSSEPGDCIHVYVSNKGLVDLSINLSSDVSITFIEQDFKEKVNEYIAANTASYVSVKLYEFGEYYPQFTEKYMSRNLYYDTDTHIQLGNYLRCIRDIKGLNLMPFYNCYAGKYVPNMYLSSAGSISSEVDQYKLLLVPIKFNQVYTIAIDCSSEVLMMPTFVSNDQVLSPAKIDSNVSVAAPALGKTAAYKNMSFKHPIKLSVSNTSATLHQYERHLSLLIQLPLSNNSTVTVLEGDYTCTAIQVFNLEKKYIDILSDKELDSILLSNLSLLRLNDKTTYPFSDRLIEYLLGNVITHEDTIPNNIQLIQEYIGLKGRPELSTPGIWNNYLRAKLFKLMTTDSNVEHIDINGYADKDVERKARKIASELSKLYS